MKGSPLSHNFAISERYKKRLENLTDRMMEETIKQIRSLYRTEPAKKYFAEDASIASQAKILMNSLSNKFSDMFKDFADGASKQMVNQVNKQSKSSLFESYKQLSGGLSIKTDFNTSRLNDVIKASVNENVNLITSIQSQFLDDINGMVNRSITTGQGLADLIPQIEKISGQTKRRAKNIALDQTRKAYNSINKIRMESAGIKKFEWIHSHGGINPRPLHESYDGKIFSFDDLPIIEERTGERGVPGQAINCKCTMRPVIEFEED